MLILLYIRFIYVPTPHTNERLCNALVDCLFEWNIDKMVWFEILKCALVAEVPNKPNNIGDCSHPCIIKLLGGLNLHKI